MTGFSDFLERLRESFMSSLLSLSEYLPLLAAAILLMLVGWLVARLLRAVFVKGGAAIDRVMARIGRPVGVKGFRLSTTIVALIGDIAFWVIILVFAAMAARVAGLDAFSTWLDRVVIYLPTLVAGGLIALAGFLLSSLIRNVIAAALHSAGSAQGELIGLAAQGMVFVTAVVIGLDQIGIDVTFLIILLAVLVGGGLLSMALAFGFGARDFVGNLIAAQQLRRMIEPGEYLRLGDVDGRVLEITPTSVILMSDGGRIHVPAMLFQQQTSVVEAGEDDD